MESIKALMHNTTLFHKYAMGEIVYLITDTDQKPYIITGLLHSITGGLQYRLEQGTNSTWAYEETFSDVKDMALKTGN